jgi:hypothetical protein
MTDEQLVRYYEHQGRYNEKRVERYWSDPDYREHRRRQNAEAKRRQYARQAHG